MEEYERERRAIQKNLLEALKECQTRFGSGQELATERDARVVILCSSIERALGHGLRPHSGSKQSSLTDMVRGLLQTDPRGSSELYSFIASFLTKHELERFQMLKNVSTEIGKARAWIRCTLNEHTLEKYCGKMFAAQEKPKLEKFYEPWAFMRDEELCAVLETISQGMKSILFALNVDSMKLDPEEPVGPAVEASYKEDISAPAPVMAPDARECQIRRKKKKPTSQMVTLDSAPSSIVASPVEAGEDAFLQAFGKSPSMKAGLTPISDSLGLSYGDLIPVKFEEQTEGDGQSTISGRSERTVSVKSNATSLSEGELREALETLVERRKQLELEIERLKAQLLEEGEKARRSEEKFLRAENKNTHLSRELEQVKNQLKKYVHAVQMLKDDGIKDNELRSLEMLPENSLESSTASNNSMGYAVEDPTNYEAKLVQVAEMHAELMEFNERLQKQLAMKESTIRRLREELTDLRGPLAEEDSSSDTHSVTSDYDTASQFRPTINIWIPSAFLAGHGSDAFHVYQIYIRIGEDEWNVYRRYSQFYSLHKALSKGQSVFNSFDFPPKKSLGNKDAKLVQERRKRLQRYLRCVINWLLQGNSRLSQNSDKATLIEVMPFFGDRDQAHVRRRRSPVRRAQEAQSYYNGL
ncbi:sorting nexin-29 [Galendromus occidentalis]|uniref:Sorting nexin-29 n=1 Tax=Galendromus occidentalis TaxID=34638 RepID=A0AAJ7PAG0_9ACAR|nr:sorting nexin-29 [Galendromus occidentalis]